MTGVGVTPSSRWMTVSTPLAASTSSAVRWPAGQRVRVLAHVERAVDALAAPVVADGLGDGAMWASVNEPRSGEPRCPLVRKITR